MSFPAIQIPLFGFTVAALGALATLGFLLHYLLERRRGLRLVREGGLKALLHELAPTDLGGYRVKVDAKASTLTLTRSDVELGVRRLHLACPTPKADAGTEALVTGVAALDRFFGGRRADPGTAARLRANRDRLTPVVRFLRRWGNIAELRADERSVTFRWRPWLGAPHGVPPARVIAAQLPEMLAVANGILGAAAVSPLIPRSEAFREDGARLLFARGEPVPRPLILERPGTEPETLAPEALLLRLYEGGLSPLARVSWEGQPPLPIAYQPLWQRLFAGALPDPAKAPAGPSSLGRLASRSFRAVAYGPVGTLVIGGVVALSGLFSAWTYYDWDQHARIARWPSVSARVVDSKAHYYAGRSSSSSDARSRGPGSTTSTKGGYGWRVTYAYAVSGKGYTSNRHCLVNGTVLERGEDTKSQAEELARRYPAGSEIPIRYDPEDPAEAVFRDLCRYPPGIQARLYRTMQGMAAACATLLCLGLCFVFWRLWLRRRRAG